MSTILMFGDGLCYAPAQALGRVVPRYTYSPGDNLSPQVTIYLVDSLFASLVDSASMFFTHWHRECKTSQENPESKVESTKLSPGGDLSAGECHFSYL